MRNDGVNRAIYAVIALCAPQWIRHPSADALPFGGRYQYWPYITFT